MPRTSKSEVVAVFERLARTAGVPVGGNFDPSTRTNSAGWSLDYAGCYGGWTISGHDGAGTGESRPLGEFRMPAREFVAAMHVAINAVEASKAGR